MGEPGSWRLHSGQYLGEISALCFLNLPSHLSSLPFLLAGTGSQLLLYDLKVGGLADSFHVLEGIRVHGICCSFINCRDGMSSSTVAFRVAVFGERRVKLFRLDFRVMLGCAGPSKVCSDMILNHLLPKFSHWVLDVIFLKEDNASSVHDESNLLAVGLSNNSVCIWDLLRSNMILEVRCPEKCLLYSMRLWGCNLKVLRVASGTIYNEIIVWRVAHCSHSPSLETSVEEFINLSGSFCEHRLLHDHQYEAIYLSRLTGHEGSIFRITWFSDGSKLMSVSDDRSARIWTIPAESKESAYQREAVDPNSVGVVLFGHDARVWDCFITDSLIVTAGEDCTCRVWRMDGNPLKVIKEHTGRGIWRCLYDSSSSLLITAGFDSSIKVHQLHASLSTCLLGKDGEIKEFKDRAETFTTCIPKLSGHLGLMDSKSEYVRCLSFAREDILYVATNHGYLHHVKLFNPGNVEWTELVRISRVAIVSLDLLSTCPSEFGDIEDWIVVGDGEGKAKVVVVIGGDCTPKLNQTFSWSAEMERQLLGTYWCKSLGHRHVFTADPRGMLKLWMLCDPFESASHESIRVDEAFLVAEFASCFGIRIMCLDASFDEEVLVCGDKRGNLLVFPLSKDLVRGTCSVPNAKVSPLNYFKGAHGISSVASISLARMSFSKVEIRSTGGDGCVCYFQYDGDCQSLEFTGMKQVKELSLIQYVCTNSASADNLACVNYAIGFSSADFMIRNLMDETKVVQVLCGGWRRPHSYYIGDVPELQNCFAFVKDHNIHIHRVWIPTSERNLFSRVLHMQFHGREIHSLCFIPEGSQVDADINENIFTRLCWIATGCEDGTVRLTSYADTENWIASKVLGEHVGGSAVRSLCFVSKTHTTVSNEASLSNRINGCSTASNNRENHSLLISVGAKRVLTSWLLQKRTDAKEEAVGDTQVNKTGRNYDPSSRLLSSMSFQWLSTDMPSKFSSIQKRKEDTTETSVLSENASNMKSNVTSTSHLVRNSWMESKSGHRNKFDNDWRYLSVTAFLVEGANCRLTVCFVVVACSDATLTLRALVLPHRLWFDVALLAPLSSPVLALQHVIIPACTTCKGNNQIGSVYIVISGSTDGSITFWDLTESVEGFMEHVAMFQPKKSIDYQKRPRTGRGSQGGRWWRSISYWSSKTDSTDTKHTSSRMVNNVPSETSSKLRSDPQQGAVACSLALDVFSSHKSDMHTDHSSSDSCEVPPLHVLNCVHQSGVNCLHVSNNRDWRDSEFGSVYHVLSGGDDQSINCFTFDLALASRHLEHNKPFNIINQITEYENMNRHYRIRILYHDRIASAHSSAVKGIWTDGTWAFSTGLDQRVRCWHLEENGRLSEHSHLICSVPEPETLDVRAFGRNQYQIAVAGRGIQMFEFSCIC